MNNTFKLIQVLQNLNRVKKSAGNLFMGVPENLSPSIAGHGYMVTNIAMFLTDYLKQKENLEINTEKVLRYCLSKDWASVVLGDISYGSPSFASFWEIDIRKEAENAKIKIIESMKNLVNDEVKIEIIELNQVEKNVVSLASNIAMLLDMLEWKYAGFKHDGFEMVWFNTIDRTKKIELEIAQKWIELLNEAYKKGTKDYNIFLAQPRLQVNPEHKL
ncbi:MAG: HD domain-containing protein [Candidatus Shapirobacteria bacterium]